MKPVGVEDRIYFDCGPDNSCFNECCRDLNQALTPYDVLRMKNSVGMSSREFLKKYTVFHIGPESGLPVVEFKPDPATGHQCPFVTPDGCRVYEDRPGSCRMYPLARGVARSRETGKIIEYYALIEEPHCKGFNHQQGISVKEWLSAQNVRDHNRENDRLMELISLKNQVRPGRLEGALSDLCYLALYNLDEFRHQIFHKDLLKGLTLSESLEQQVRTDDIALLHVGFDWVKYQLFGKDQAFKVDKNDT